MAPGLVATRTMTTQKRDVSQSTAKLLLEFANADVVDATDYVDEPVWRNWRRCAMTTGPSVIFAGTSG